MFFYGVLWPSDKWPFLVILDLWIEDVNYDTSSGHSLVLCIRLGELSRIKIHFPSHLDVHESQFLGTQIQYSILRTATLRAFAFIGNRSLETFVIPFHFLAFWKYYLLVIFDILDGNR